MGFVPSQPTCLRAAGVERPLRSALPAGACDCHSHVFGPEERFPYTAGASYIPPEAAVGCYLATLDALGIARGVVVQPSVYGTDNSCLIDALKSAPSRLRGVVAIDIFETDTASLREMGEAGVRGVRINAAGPSFKAEHLGVLSEICQLLDWHIDLQVSGIEQVLELSPALRGVGVPVVIEGMGKMRGSMPLDVPGFRELLALLATGGVWVKLSHMYKLSSVNAPYVDLAPIVRCLADANIHRLVWGSDWPHPLTEPMPRDEVLAELALDWFPQEADLKTVMSDNPAQLYGFGSELQVS